MVAKVLLAAGSALLIVGACSGPIEPTEQPSTLTTFHLAEAGLSFVLPPDWQVRRQNLTTRAGTVIAYIGTAASEYRCESVPNGMSCASDLNLLPGGVSVLLSSGPGRGEPLWEERLQVGMSRVEVGGLPALFQTDDPTPEADLILRWTLSMPLEPYNSYQLSAALREPGIEATQGQLLDMVASIRYEPALPPLEIGAPEALAVATALERLSAEDASYDCFPRAPGGGADAVVEQVPGYPPLTQPLAVECLTAVHATPIGLWQMDLTISWTASADHAAGSLPIKVWVDRDGQIAGESLPGVDVPYTR